MASPERRTFNDLVRDQLGTALPDQLAGRIDFSALPADAQGVILRLLALMKRSACPATEFNAQMAWLLAAVTPAMLPAAWGGRIPPLTSPGRHRKLDDYAARCAEASGGEPPVFIDLGCGFPPVTTVDTAARLTDWQVYGVDPAFSRYVLYDADARYACFNRHGELLYLQSPAKPLNDTPEALRTRFKTLFAELRPRIAPNDDRISRTVEKDGNRLVANHVRDYETPNLTFVKGDIEALRLPPARFIRCMNVLLYFEREVREAMLALLGQRLDVGGLMMVGFNHPLGIYARYAVYAKDQGALRPKEFAFSLDNLRPLGIGPWLTLIEDDKEACLLADLTRAIRSDRRFWADFDRSVDALRDTLGICTRDRDGFIRFTPEIETAPAAVLMEEPPTFGSGSNRTATRAARCKRLPAPATMHGRTRWATSPFARRKARWMPGPIRSGGRTPILICSGDRGNRLEKEVSDGLENVF